MSSSGDLDTQMSMGPYIPQFSHGQDAGIARQFFNFCLELCSDLDLISFQLRGQGTMKSRNLGPCRVHKSNCFHIPSRGGILKRGFKQQSMHKAFSWIGWLREDNRLEYSIPTEAWETRPQREAWI